MFSCVEKQDQNKSIHDLSHKTICAFEPGCPSREFVDHTCTHCGTDTISSWYEPWLDTERQVDHDQWKLVEEAKPIKTKGKKEPVMRKIKALRLVTSKISCTDLLINLTTDMT